MIWPAWASNPDLPITVARQHVPQCYQQHYQGRHVLMLSYIILGPFGFCTRASQVYVQCKILVGSRHGCGLKVMLTELDQTYSGLVSSLTLMTAQLTH